MATVQTADALGSALRAVLAACEGNGAIKAQDVCYDMQTPRFDALRGWTISTPEMHVYHCSIIDGALIVIFDDDSVPDDGTVYTVETPRGSVDYRDFGIALFMYNLEVAGARLAASELPF